MLDRAAIVAVSTLTTAAVGAAASPKGQYDLIAESLPIAIGVIMCIIVRALIDMEAKKKKAWNYNVLVMVLCSIFTAVFVHEYELTAGAAMLFGIATGATGVGIISYGKPLLASIIGKANDAMNGPSK